MKGPGYSGRAAAARTQTVWRPGAQFWPRHTIVLNVWVWSRHQPKLILSSQAYKLDRLQATSYKIL